MPGDEVVRGFAELVGGQGAGEVLDGVRAQEQQQDPVGDLQTPGESLEHHAES